MYHFFTWLVSDYWQPGALLVLTGNLALLFPKKLMISVGVDSAYKDWVLDMCSLLTVSEEHSGAKLGGPALYFHLA